MVARHWQQRRSGNVRRRLDYAHFMALSGDQHSALILRPAGDSCQSSQENFGDMLQDSIRTSFTQSRDESSASESLSQSALVASEEGTDVATSDMKRMMGSAASSHEFERNIWKNGRFSMQQALSVKQLDGLGALLSGGSVMRTTKGNNASNVQEREQRRGTRTRKPKVPYEEESVPRRPNKKLRQTRILRHLGLVAPHGSPFTSSCIVRTTV